MVWMALVTIGMGLLFIGLGLPMWFGRVPPNSWYCFRIPLTLDYPNIWYPVNAWAGKWLVRLGVGCLPAGAPIFWLPQDWLDWYVLGVMIALMIGILALLIIGIGKAKALARTNQQPPEN